MHAYVEPLDRLREALRWFVAVPELLLLHVTTGPELRTAALAEIAKAQYRAENSAAIFVSTIPAESSIDDWNERIDELGETFALFVEEGAKAEPPRTFEAPRLGAGRGLDGFITALAQYAAAMAPSFGGLILALAPEGITETAAWQADLRRLLAERSLGKVRFVLVEQDPAPALQFALELGGLGERVDIRVEHDATREMLRTMVSGMRSAPRGADGFRLAGMAGPREAPPPRKGRVPLEPAAAQRALSEAGADPALAAAEALQAVRVEAMSASLALQDGRPAEAVDHQIKARDLAEQAGLTREATLLELMLGGYLLQGGGTQRALSVFERVAERAKKLGHADLEAQAHMASGGALLATGRPFDAAQAYTAGAQPAERQGTKAIAIECYRMVGQVLLAQGRETEATTAWRRAIAIAEDAPKEERALSSAPIAARDLAAVYRRHGLLAQATALESQIAGWERAAATPNVSDTEPPAPGSGSAR